MSVKHYVHTSEQPKGKAQRREFADCFINELMAAGRSFDLKQLVIPGISPTIMTQ